MCTDVVKLLSKQRKKRVGTLYIARSHCVNYITLLQQTEVNLCSTVSGETVGKSRTGAWSRPMASTRLWKAVLCCTRYLGTVASILLHLRHTTVQYADCDSLCRVSRLVLNLCCNEGLGFPSFINVKKSIHLMAVFLVHITAIIRPMFAGGMTMLLWFSRCLSTWFFVFVVSSSSCPIQKKKLIVTHNLTHL